MTNDVTRRNFVALAGAGAALSGCSLVGSNSGEEVAVQKLTTQVRDKIAGEFSKKWKYEDHGKNPHNAPEYESTVGPLADFDPKFIQIVHIRVKNNWSFQINHANFQIPRKTDQSISDDSWRLQTALKIIKKKNPNSDFLFHSINGIDPKPYDKNMGVGRPNFADHSTFQSLDFGSQHEVFFYFDSPNVVLIPGNLISFAPTRDGVKKAQPNYSFFKARIVEDPEMGDLSTKGSMVRVENRFTDKNGKLINDDSIPDGGQAKDTFWYAMNIHYALPVKGHSSQIGFVPMVIDPDTGNGMGNSP